MPRCLPGLVLGLSVFALFADETGSKWRSMFQTGNACYEREDYTRSVQLLEAALNGATEQNASELELAQIWNVLGAAYEATGKLQEATEFIGRATAVRRKLLPEPHRDLAISLSNEASVLWALHKLKEAEAVAIEAQHMWSRLGDTSNLDYAATLNNLAAIYRDEARYQDSIAALEQARQIYSRLLGPTDPKLIKAIGNLATAWKDAGNYQKAEEFFAQGINLSLLADDGPARIRHAL